MRFMPEGLILLLLIGWLSACGQFSLANEVTPPSPTPNEPAGTPPNTLQSLIETEWILISLRGQPPLAGSNTTLEITLDQLNGYAGCNWYGGPYTLAADQLKITEISNTAQGCQTPEGILQHEETYLNTLREVVAYQIVTETLRLSNAAGETLLLFRNKPQLPMNPADLEGTHWQLQSLNGHSLLEGSRITLEFSEQNFQGFAGCRDYTGAYQASGDDIRFPQLAMTQTDCPDPALLDQEGEYTTALSEATHYRLSEGQLEIETAPGKALLFIAHP